MIKIEGVQITAARNLLKIKQAELAAACGIAARTLSLCESATTGQPHQATIRTIVMELTKRGIEFSNGTGLGVRLDFKKAAEFAAANTTGDASPPRTPRLR